MKLSDVINELVQERGLDKHILSGIVCEGMLAAYQKKYPELPLHIEFDKKTADMNILIEKEVAAHVDDEDAQITLRKARAIDPKIELGQKIRVPFDGRIGRIEILRAKQVIANAIRKIEAQAIYDEFKDKEGLIIQGVVHKCEHGGSVVKIGETLAFLPKSLMIPEDKCIVGYPVRAILKEVLLEPRNENQLILDRSSDEFVRQLFE